MGPRRRVPAGCLSVQNFYRIVWHLKPVSLVLWERGRTGPRYLEIVPMKARVIANPYNIGNGYYPVGQIVEIARETAHYYVLVKSSYSINKEKMALTGWAGRYAHTIEFEIIEEAPTVEADPVSKRVDPISESVARVYAKLPVGVAVREALDLLYPLEFVITAYPLGAQDMIPDNPSPAVAGDLEREIRSGPGPGLVPGWGV